MNVPYPPVDGSEPCASGDPERFFPTYGGERSEAVKAECDTCHIKGECLAYGLTYKVTGIWGGATVTEREQIRAREGTVAQPLDLETLGLRMRTPNVGHGSWQGVDAHRARWERNCPACRAYVIAQAQLENTRRKEYDDDK